MNISHFTTLDRNRDGYLSGNEITPELAPYARPVADGRLIVTRDSLVLGPRPTPAPAPYAPAPGPAPAPTPAPYAPAPVPAPAPTPAPRQGLPELADYEPAIGFIAFSAQKTFSGQGVLADIERHLPAKFGSTYRDSCPVTWGHETTHGINSHLRNTPAYNPSGAKVNGFYVGDDKAIVLAEPPISKSSVARYTPDSLKGSRFAMYVTGQRAFEKEPLYLMDEWVAYANGAAVGVDLAKRGQWKQGSRDAVAGAVEFTGYGFAMALAIESQQPGYLAQNPQLKAFIAWQGIRTMDLFREGLQVPAFASFQEQHTYYERFKSAADAQPLRDFIRAQWGEPYLQRMLK